jgi:trk system potassium uptake protein TrkA
MKAIVAGCGRVGALLAGRLTGEGHEVAVIDRDPLARERLGKNFQGTFVKGVIFDQQAVKKAGIEQADAFIAVSSGDNSNIVAALLAREVFKVPKVVARIFEPRRAQIYRRLGIPTVSSVSWASHEILTLVMHAQLEREVSFGDGEVQLARVEIGHRLAGRTPGDLTIPGEIQVVAVIRSGRSFIPGSGTVFAERDLLEVAVATTALPKLKKMVAL